MLWDAKGEKGTGCAAIKINTVGSVGKIRGVKLNKLLFHNEVAKLGVQSVADKTLKISGQEGRGEMGLL